MDLDALIAARHADWNRLDRLGRRRRLSGAEADELIALYQAGAADLSAIQSQAGSTREGDRLSVLLSRARLALGAQSEGLLSSLPRFALVDIPAALYRVRWTSLGVTLVFAATVAVVALWMLSDPRILDAVSDPASRRYYAEVEFIGYYSEHSEGAFAGLVWTNNAYIATMAVALGITGIGPLYVLMANAIGLGQSAAVMASEGRLDDFFLYIAPHGQLEMFSIFVAGAAGLQLFWALVVPGRDRTRREALAQEGRALVTVAVGLVFALLLSGIVEGFVTRQPWPWPVKIGLGTLALAAFLLYMLVLGRRAVRAGATGDLGDEFARGAAVLRVG